MLVEDFRHFESHSDRNFKFEDKRKTQLSVSLKVFVVLDSTKVCWKQQKQNTRTLNFILHQKSLKSIQQSSRMSCLKLRRWFQKSIKNKNTQVMSVLTVMFSISKLNEHIRSCIHDIRVFVFAVFLKSSMQLETTRSPRPLNGF